MRPIAPAIRSAPRRSRERPFTVAEVLGQVRACLEDNFRPLLVRGEVRDLRQPRSGHLYFTLQDGRASLRIVVFASELQRIPHPLRDGAEALVWGRVSAYPRSGNVQLIAEHFEPAGLGAQWVRREQLRKRLAEEGLFAPERKQPIPRVPRAVGVVTSTTGSAVHDVITTLRRRYPAARVILRSARVNGAAAGPEVASAIADLDRRGAVDVLLVVRGGGSQEDLACFDDEGVVRAIARARTPVIAGVGHEDDVTLADLVADRRAPTPTGAAELAVPRRTDLLVDLDRIEERLTAAVRSKLSAARRQLEMAERAHGLHAPAARLQRWKDRLGAAAARLQRVHPRVEVERRRAMLEEAGARLSRVMASAVSAEGARLAAAAGRLEALSPLRVLARGYSLTTAADGRLVQSAGEVEVGDVLTTRLARGILSVRVEAREEPEND